MPKVALYVRVSTIDKQDFNRQISDLRKVVTDEGYNKDDLEVFHDKIS